MLTRDPRTPESQSAQSRNRRIWPWAAGSIILPLLVIVTTLLGARAVGRARLAAEVTPAQTLAPLDVSVVVQPPTGVAFWALASGATGGAEIVALSDQAPVACLPQPPCAAIGLATRYLAYDAATGRQLMSQPIPPIDATHCATPDGAPAGALYAICDNKALTFDLATGALVSQRALPYETISPDPAVDSGARALYLVGGVAPSNQSLLSYDLASGAFVAMQGLRAGPVSSPVADAEDGRALVVEGNGGTAPMLVAFAARTLAPLGAVALPAGTRAGPFNPAADLLFLFGPDGSVGAINLGQTQFSGAQPALPAAVTQFGPLKGAKAIGFDVASQTLVALYVDSVTAYDAESLRPYASAPVSGAWDPQRPLGVDSARGVVYAPDRSGAIVGLQLAPHTSRAATDPATAIALARAGLGPLLPAPNQAPPFLTYQTFPLAQVEAPRAFAIYGGGTGWGGPYGGSAGAKVTAVGAQPGDYTVAFTVTWDQLFPHTHTWTVELLPDGRVRMVSDSGDGIP